MTKTIPHPTVVGNPLYTKGSFIWMRLPQLFHSHAITHYLVGAPTPFDGEDASSPFLLWVSRYEQDKEKGNFIEASVLGVREQEKLP